MPIKTVTLAHGAGALETRELIDQVFAKRIGNEILARAEDAAIIEPAKLAVSIDGFTVSPIIFAGGDIGKLAVAGSCNDVAVTGARPRYLAASFILEEGLSIATLETIADSFAAELAKNGAIVVSADTKVVPKGAAGGVVIGTRESSDRPKGGIAEGSLYIATTAIGEVVLSGLDARGLREGDYILASGSAGDHGAAIFAAREGIELSGDLKSDCASLWPLVETLIAAQIPIVAMRDATRGGLAAVCNEWAIASNASIELEQAAIVVKPAVQGACELLGFEPYALANEGMMIVAVRGEAAAARAVETMRSHALGKDAAVIGRVAGSRFGRVAMRSPHGSTRFLEMPGGELLPRIC